jgi:hypothetical protein
MLNCFFVVSGDNDLPGLTDTEKPRMRGPKRATKIRKLFNLTKEDDVRKYVNTYRRTFVSATGEIYISDGVLQNTYLCISIYLSSIVEDGRKSRC